jgi:hypothetical protein
MEEKNLETTEEKTVPIEEQSAKSLWQQTKESWYDKVPLTVKQLDIIIACCIGGLVLTFIAIALDAMGIF